MARERWRSLVQTGGVVGSGRRTVVLRCAAPASSFPHRRPRREAQAAKPAEHAASRPAPNSDLVASFVRIALHVPPNPTLSRPLSVAFFFILAIPAQPPPAPDLSSPQVRQLSLSAVGLRYATLHRQSSNLISWSLSICAISASRCCVQARQSRSILTLWKGCARGVQVLEFEALGAMEECRHGWRGSRLKSEWPQVVKM